jgi:predicted peroxiredoxin
MGSILVNITHGPEHPFRAVLGLLVAKTGLAEGHEVSIFLAGDAVHLIRDSVLDGLVGPGSGSAREHFDAIVAGGGKFYLSGMSSKLRSVLEEDIAGKPAEFVMPEVLVSLAMDKDRLFTY